MEETTNGDNSGWSEQGKAFGSERFACVALNGKPNVDSETQDRMLSVVEDLGSTTNLAARSMQSRAKSLVGLIAPDIAYSFAVDGMQGVNRAIAESKFYPLVYTTDDGRKSGSAHTNPRIRRRAERHAVAADQGVDAGCRTDDYRCRRRRIASIIYNSLSVT